MPFLDEFNFRQEIEKIIGPECYENTLIKEIYIEKRLDLAHVGILLIVLRLSYLTLFSNKSSINKANLNNTGSNEEAQELKYLLCSPISINVVVIARSCLFAFSYSEKLICLFYNARYTYDYIKCLHQKSLMG